MRSSLAPPKGDAQVHLTTFRELERHCRDEAKHAGYRRMLADFGIDQDRFAALVRHPRLVLAEQPGSLFCGDDMLRLRLHDVLRRTYDFHPSSGVLSLGEDGFTCRGQKKYLVLLHLHEQVEPVRLIGASFIRRHRNRVYSALILSGAAYERMVAIFDTCLAMLESARISPETFADEVLGLCRGGLRRGIRPLFPRRLDRRSLRELGAEIGAHDLGQALEPLRAARCCLRPGVGWAEYWNHVNSVFLGTRIGQLGPLFNRFLLTVDDPVRMSRHLARCCGLSTSRPVAVASIIAADEKYRLVFFDPSGDRFFYCPRVGARSYFSWRQVRQLAEQGRTGGPSGTLEYLLMAASGIYLVADPFDGHNRFEVLARRVHRRYTGLPFPYVSFVDDTKRATFNYLEIFEETYERRCRATLERFFA